MHNNILILGLCLLVSACQGISKDGNDNSKEAKSKSDKAENGPITILIHGGAGGMSPSGMSKEKQAIYKTKLKKALNRGYSVLKKGGKAIMAVESAIQVMENDSFYNAGKGSVLTHQGNVEMDASIMRGVNKNAGAVASVTNVKNPISGARAVMKESKHVMLAGEGAELFAREQGLTLRDSGYFLTQSRYRSLQRHLENSKEEKGKDGVPSDYLGTVGAVALDKNGNLAAGTSTGGMTNKQYGRIGDSPIIGAGTYADNTACAVSATGHGEYFIRNAVAYDVSAHMKYQDMPLRESADTVINHQLKALGGKGGIIALDQAGNYTATFNTSGMFRAFKQKGEEAYAKIFQ